MCSNIILQFHNINECSLDYLTDRRYKLCVYYFFIIHVHVGYLYIHHLKTTLWSSIPIIFSERWGKIQTTSELIYQKKYHYTLVAKVCVILRCTQKYQKTSRTVRYVCMHRVAFKRYNISIYQEKSLFKATMKSWTYLVAILI